jgi:hypothetical protein
VNSTPAAPDSRGLSVAVFLENCRRVEGIVVAGVADVEHDNGYAKVVEREHIDWHEPEGAIAILRREFGRAASERRFLKCWRTRRARVRRRSRRTCVRQSWRRPIIQVGALPPPHARPSAVPRRCITLGPPMCLDLRHSFDGVIHSFASGRKRYRRSTVNLKAMTNRPEVSAWSQRVRLDPERERGGLLTHDRNMGWRQFVPQGRPRGLPQPSGPPPSQRLTRRGRLERNRGFSCRVRSDDTRRCFDCPS